VGGNIEVDRGADGVAVVELRRPPNNFLDVSLVRDVADAFEALGADVACRCIVLGSEGKHFCAGADFEGSSGAAPILPGEAARSLYAEAVRLFGTPVPVVAAVQGAAVGGGLGLALAADFRIASAESRFVPNFSRLGMHQGFGVSVTLPRVVGRQRALELLYTGRPVGGAAAHQMGLCDRLVTTDRIRAEAHALASEIAAAAPLAVRSIRSTLRGDLAEAVRRATERELEAQEILRGTRDHAEGVAASLERRDPRFAGD
jgi:enoyl-CoA hydratase/carnithine racemase